jgi:hypothetical protein
MSPAPSAPPSPSPALAVKETPTARRHPEMAGKRADAEQNGRHTGYRAWIGMTPTEGAGGAEPSVVLRAGEARAHGEGRQRVSLRRNVMSEDVPVNTGAVEWPHPSSAYFAVRRMQAKFGTEDAGQVAVRQRRHQRRRARRGRDPDPGPAEGRTPAPARPAGHPLGLRGPVHPHLHDLKHRLAGETPTVTPDTVRRRAPAPDTQLCAEWKSPHARAFRAARGGSGGNGRERLPQRQLRPAAGKTSVA